MLIVFADSIGNSSSTNAQEIKRQTEVFRMLGCRILTIPKEFNESISANDVLAYLPHFPEIALAVWIGYIPTTERYKALYQAAINKNIKLLNTPNQHKLSMEFDQFYPMIAHLTLKSLVMQSEDDLNNVDITFPVFVKGAVKSDKDKGWNAVTAQTLDELNRLVSNTLSNSSRSRGKVIVRELVNIKTVANDPNGFPIGREYRVFIYNKSILEMGFYWDDYEDPQTLSEADKRIIRDLALEVAERLDVSFLSVDVAQLETDEWTVIEVGDGQFSGLSNVDPLKLWTKLVKIVT